MTRTALATLPALALLLAVAGPAAAQESLDLSQEEIVERFKAQKTRGLSIAPVTPAAPETGAAATAAAAPVTTDEPLQIATLDDSVAVNIAIAFDFDSAALRADQKPKLTAMCGAMREVEQEAFLILGHTDASGSDAYNKRLSRLRAEEVKRFLVSDCGIAPERLEATGVGEDALLDPADPRSDVNRRVEFQVLG